MPHQNIWDEMQRLQSEMDKLMYSFFRHPIERPLLEGKGSKGAIMPRMRQPLADIWETGKEVIAKVELPGVDKKDIHINLTEHSLEIKVEKKAEKEEKHKGAYSLERSYTGFYRYFSLPAKIKTDKTEANYKNGVLEIRMPKLEKSLANVKRLEIK